MMGDKGGRLAGAGECGSDAVQVAGGVARCILGQIRRAYPCAASQVLAAPDELALPQDRFPAFFGSFDWHSCVHSHWALVRMLATGVLAGDASLEAAVVATLDESLRAELLVREAQSWEKLPAHTELPYGLTWLLALDAELARPAVATEHPAWRTALAPLVNVLAPRVHDWAASLALPVRSGVHSDTAWSLAMAWDWACVVGDTALAQTIAGAARTLYLRDVDAPCAYEPSGQTFTSPILNEAALMARVLPAGAGAGEFDGWLRGFLPRMFVPVEAVPVEATSVAAVPVSGLAAPADGATTVVSAETVTSVAFAGPDASDTPAASIAPLLPDAPHAWNGTDYLGVHEVALPLARCLAARDAAAACQDPRARAALVAQAVRWGTQGLAGLTLDGYLADHWVGSFALAVAAPLEPAGASASAPALAPAAPVSPAPAVAPGPAPAAPASPAPAVAPGPAPAAPASPTPAGASASASAPGSVGASEPAAFSPSPAPAGASERTSR